ncbi:MAG: GNAT family N-acetyltransferase [Thermomicrobiales bacterium]
MIKGDLVNLQAMDRHHAVELHRWLNNPEVMRYWGLPSSCPSLTEVQGHIEVWLEGEARLGRPECLMIETLESRTIGFIQFGEFNACAQSTELSMLIGEPELWRQGLGSDALGAAVTACFEDWGLRRIWARSEAFNERAHQVFKRIGFVHEATLRDASFFEGTFHDLLVFGLLESDRHD